MVKAHTAGSFDIVTRFSSWTASLAFVLKFWRGKGNKYHSRFHPDNISDLVLKDSLYISALDTALLPDDQEVFWVPSLDFLAPGQLVDHDEYLVHGVVHGPGYKTLPLRVFLNAHRDCVRAAWEHSCAACDGSLLVNTPARTTTVTPITTQCIARARAVGEAYGGTFALPMTLATIALHQRELNYFDDGVPEEVMQLVLRGVDGLEVPAGWSDEPTIVSNVLSENNREAAEFCSLMRAVLNRRGSGGSGWTSVD
ncbi:hypothetical protein LTR09_000347 [Extremus antarcticus]|uniref:Uncharacterized protein n=1 Tax=Extremus antarcticus TaxID=702011 RepID=A0AAJ0LX89_9PEZI|nr:hypothetical protein LTR09_000347 [Extremus antarcticus]